nr:MAG TPA: hypothetical protein [Caudoviricetes sp.]
MLCKSYGCLSQSFVLLYGVTLFDCLATREMTAVFLSKKLNNQTV